MLGNQNERNVKPTLQPTPPPTIAPPPELNGMKLLVNGRSLNPGQAVFDIENGQLVFSITPNSYGKYDQDSIITLTAYPTVDGSTVILGGTTSLNGNTGTILARGTEWSMTASITLPPGIAIPIPTATPVPVSWLR